MRGCQQVIGRLLAGYWDVISRLLACYLRGYGQVTGRYLVGLLAHLQIIGSLVGGTGRLCARYQEVARGYRSLPKACVGEDKQYFASAGRLLESKFP